ncbi:NAD(P)/FAD-dependent oxidoreductase [Halotalea alkalilenta]|uniref:NAD(P)/FAD-dependent oxidoreductase n=1 Tax=Halotalea alkalilenta TaxID=376489 RepID=UPI000480C27F|nr:FAD-binding oxidoreductase [Halotalea alkalilenta]
MRSRPSRSAYDEVSSYYSDTRRVTLAPTPVLEGFRRADVCVIGGGITGCSTALHLAERGLDVVLLEAQEIGHGASGRSGGQILTGLGTGIERVEGELGPDAARRIWEMSREAVALTERLIERHSIPCDYRKGYVHAANRPRHVRHQRDWIERMASRYDYHGLDWLDRDQLRAHVVTDAYLGGVFDHDAGHLHPLDYTLGLARAAQRAGASLHTGNRVAEIDAGEGGRLRVSGRRGIVEAEFVVQATNAYFSGLVPELDAKLMPVDNYIVATAPLSEAQVAASLPSDAAVSDARFVLDYYRLCADRRLLFGGQVSYTGRQPFALDLRIKRRIKRLFPALAGLDIDYRSGGKVAITLDRAPHFGRHGDKLYFAQGYSGHGMALAGLAGQLIGEAIAGQAERFDLFARLEHRDFPGGRRLRTPLLALATTFYKLRDLL